MKHYLEIAKQYFQHFEGRHLYPSFKNYRLLIWLAVTSIWFGALIRFFVSGYATAPRSASFASIIVPEVVWMFATFWLIDWKHKQIIDTTNSRFGTLFTTTAECRFQMLVSVMSMQPSEFLKAAKEIDDLTSLQRKFRMHSDVAWAELSRNIYDKDSKARLLTLVIALVSITIALTVKSDATLETVFDVYSEPGGRSFLLLLLVAFSVGFFALVGLRLFVLAVVDFLAAWSIKLFGSSAFTRWLLSYLVRDLVTYHASLLVQRSTRESPETADAVVGLAKSNEIPIDLELKILTSER